MVIQAKVCMLCTTSTFIFRASPYFVFWDRASCSPGLPLNSQSFCLHLPSAGIIGVCHHTWIIFLKGDMCMKESRTHCWSCFLCIIMVNFQSTYGKIAQIKGTFHKDNFSWEHAFSSWREVDFKSVWSNIVKPYLKKKKNKSKNKQTKNLTTSNTVNYSTQWAAWAKYMMASTNFLLPSSTSTEERKPHRLYCWGSTAVLKHGRPCKITVQFPTGK